MEPDRDIVPCFYCGRETCDCERNWRQDAVRSGDEWWGEGGW